MIVKQLTDRAVRQETARKILEALPDWFGIEEAREEYIKNSAEELCVT